MLLVKYLDEIKMKDIDPNVIKGSLVRLVNEDDISKTRLRDITVTAKQIIERAVDDSAIVIDPMRKITSPPRPKPNRNSQQVNTAQSLFESPDALPLDRNVLAVCIGLATGLRRSEG